VIKNIEKNSSPIPIQSKKNSDQRWDKYIPDPYKKVASAMEKQFLNFMISKMNQTIKKNDKNSSAMDYYQGLLTQERSSIMANNNGGVGIKKLILDQIYPNHFRNKITLNHFQRSQEQKNPKQVIKKYQEINSIKKKEIKNE
jgi:Rod binding domain-containing protein